MATAKKWSNVAVAMQSAVGATKTITGITKANPGVVTSTAHGLANGDYVVLAIQGMSQLNDRVVRIANVAANTFELEGIDTSLYDTFSSGTAAAVTFGTSITTATNVTASGGDYDMIPTTTIHDAVKSQMPGIANGSSFQFENIWDPSDTGLKAMKSAADAQAKKAIKFTFGVGGSVMVGYGYVGATLLPAGQGQGLVTTSTTVTMNSVPAFY